jgi:A/G-specific adenine glycosylase
MPWRETKDPYRILVSEVMLQQTQVPRVLEKYREFLERFPTLEDLAAARLSEVLAVWQGLGYNRRAKFLHRTAATIRDEYAGVLPADPKELERLPGIGPNTAGSIAAFAYDRPVVFIETNIRRAVLHHFFADAEGVTDVELFPYIEAVLDRSNPREWYYALMDWGAEIAKQFPNPNRRSAHYSRQSPFENSDRQVRGRILRLLSRQDLSGPLSIETIAAEIGFESSRVQEVTDRLKAEGLVAETGEGIRIDGE